MIKFILRNNNSTQENKKIDNIFDSNIGSYIIPRPKLLEKMDNVGIEYSLNFITEVNGDFISMKNIEMRQKYYELVEPNWDLKEFIKHSNEWLDDSWFHRLKNNIKLTLESHSKDTLISMNEFEKFVPKGYQSQAYCINSDENCIELYSWTKTGMYYAFLTLGQIGIIKESKIYFPKIRIFDYPDFEFRALEDDISRGQRPTMEHFKEWIKYLSRLKINIEALYIEDMFKFEKYPMIGRGRGVLTKEEIRELEEYALNYFVDIQPAVEMFGHMDNLLMNPEFRKYGEFPGSQCLDITSPESHQLADDLLKELCNAFKTPMFHLVCDESFDSGLGKSREFQKENGKSETIAAWFNFLIETVKKYGKTSTGFAHDCFIHYPKIVPLVKDNVTVVAYWDYSKKKQYKKVSKLVENGFDVAITCTTFDWSRHYPYYDYAEMNNCYMARDGLERGAKFMLSSKFGDHFNENFRENIRYGMVLISQSSWDAHSPQIFDENGELETSKLKKAYINYYFGTDDQRIIEIMDILNKQNKVLPRFPNGMNNRYWMDPYAREITKKELKYQIRFVKESSKILRLLKELNDEKVLKKNKFHLDYLEFASRMALHFGVKILSAEAAWSGNFTIVREIPHYLNDLISKNLIPGKFIESTNFSNYIDLMPLFEWLSVDILDQQQKYAILWKKQCIPEGLEYPYHRFEVLNWYYENSISDLKKNQKPDDNQLKSEWIWRDGRRTSSRWGNQKEFYFNKSFNILKPIKKVILQGIANNHMNIYLNGEYIGEVLSRWSMSQLPMVKAVQLFDVTNKIHINSSNDISIIAANWANGIGGINILIHVEYEDGMIEEIISDDSWVFSEKEPEKWPDCRESVEINLDMWNKVKSIGRPPLGWMAPISRPNWKKNWKSEISFSFGARNYIETSLVPFLGEGLYRKAFWLVPAGTKVMGSDIWGFREL